MTWSDDYHDEMLGRRPIDDATAEDLFAGRSVPADLEPLATMMRALRDVSRQPVQPTPDLAGLMAAGTAVSDDPRPEAAGQQLPRRVRRIRTAVEVVAGRAGWVPKLAAGGVVVAVVGFGSAGFAGSLPAPLQDGFETAVESVTPYQFPQRATGADGPGRAGGPAVPPAPAGPGSGSDAGPDRGTGPDSGSRPAPGSGPRISKPGEPGGPDPGRPGEAGPPDRDRPPAQGGPPVPGGPPAGGGPPGGTGSSGSTGSADPGAAGQPPAAPVPGQPPRPTTAGGR